MTLSRGRGRGRGKEVEKKEERVEKLEEIKVANLKVIMMKTEIKMIL